jgi:Protein of unknown function (DUF2924)
VTKMAVDVAAELARLAGLTNFELRSEWRQRQRMQPPKTLSRDLLIRGITYSIQERALAALSKSLLRQIAGSPADASFGHRRHAAPSVAIKPGTRLLREWHGVTHTVLVHADGVEWRGRRYKSLSVVAREITGAHWSGPRFFGLARRASARADAPVAAEHAQT